MVRRSERNPVSELKPTRARMLVLIRQAASDSRNLFFSEHAYERMEQRGITDLDVLRVLRTGEIEGEIEAGKRAGEWKCKVTARMKGNRDVGVATIVMTNGRLRIATVEWEDL